MPWFTLPDFLTGYDADNAAAAAKAEAQRQALDAAAREAGKISAAEAARRAANGYGVDPTAQREEITATFTDSVVDNAKSMSQGVSDAINTGVWGILKTIPLTVWLIAGVALLFYMGGGVWLKGALNRK